LLLGIAKRATHSEDTKCSCVVTVPEFFDDPSRESVRNAAIQAGWNVLQVVNAPSVTPFTYGINVTEPLNDTYVKTCLAYVTMYFLIIFLLCYVI